ncbi:Imm6 family immunity protein [Burkholderia stagnalis]|uniref:Imm6 family immunity protein n=1 Tax=Burkholderia stagnalis TaxID=1503054 RepID=UPI0009C0BE1E|nr:Imm6 family immunity protein [Burkholderia stagnalis]
MLAIANCANETIKAAHSESFEACRHALAACKDWLDGKPITPESLAFYLDADEIENPWMQEAIFRGDPVGFNALVFVMVVISHAVHLAYVKSGKLKYMSEIIFEAGSRIFWPIAECGAPYGLY